ncbi:MAG: hypothetical protein R2788_21845 [Saprospiraceae bacterium]
MDKIKIRTGHFEHFRRIFENKYANIKGENSLVTDKEHSSLPSIDHRLGRCNKFIHDCPMHFDIINNKI